LRPLLIARCLTCSDVVAATVHRFPDPEFVVIALTRDLPNSTIWPVYERLTFARFRARFLEGDERLVQSS
jgi:hypothetical protein